MSPKPKRNRLEKLQHSWAKASTQQRYEFLQWLATSHEGSDGNGLAAVDLIARIPIASGRYLLPSAVIRIRAVMTARSLSAEAVMTELGFEEDRKALSRALSEGASLRLAVVAALENWLLAHAEPGHPAP
ncbi:hypothetical protein ACO34A_04020 [Rhizobium sp. ACO-34A]|nr:hypothetical protein [Rhizobium sp. ACO-34A]ATN32968.1 hypothetical protein ACO34A_04020 [Rhizobium sp. ACO-34A]